MIVVNLGDPLTSIWDCLSVSPSPNSPHISILPPFGGDKRSYPADSYNNQAQVEVREGWNIRSEDGTILHSISTCPPWLAFDPAH